MPKHDSLIAKAREIASERDEKAAESMMIAEAHRNAGNSGTASGWYVSAEHAEETAATLRALASIVEATP